MKTNATAAAIVLLGLCVSASPSFAVPVVPLELISLAQAETPTGDLRRQSEELVKRARAAMKGGNLELAERWVAEAEKLNVAQDGLLSRFADTPKKVRKDLDKLKTSKPKAGGLPGLLRGNKPDPLQQPAPMRLPEDATKNAQRIPTPGAQNPFALPAGVAAQPMNLQAQQRQARSLLAQANAALSRGDLAASENLARQAQQLRLPERAYEGGTTPWELLLKVDKQRRQQGNTNIAGARPTKLVEPALFQPGQDNSYVRTASAEELVPPTNALAQQSSVIRGLQPLTQQPPPVQYPNANGEIVTETEITGSFPAGNSPSVSTPTDASAPATTTSDFGESTYLSPESSSFPNAGVNTTVTGVSAVELIKLGEEAARGGKLDDARDYFRQAWAFEQELDQTTRQRLQEHLQFLSVGQSKKVTEKDQEEQVRIRRFIADVGREQAAIARELSVSPKTAWERMKELRERVADADIPEEASRPLLGRLNRAVTETEQFIEQNRAQIELDEQNRDVLSAIDRERRIRIESQQKLAGMVDDFNELMDQQRFSEAYILAKRARDIDAQNPVVENMVWKSRFAERLFVEMNLQERMERGFEHGLESVVESGVPFDDRYPIQFPKKWDTLVKTRQGLVSDNRSRFTDVEKEIERALRKKVQVQFNDTPLSEAITTLGRLAGVNVYLDEQGIAAEGATSDTPVSINLTDPISLQSVLNLILQPHRLGYMIQDEVLRITSEQARSGDVYAEPYYVGDLVIPIPNFMPGYQSGMAGALAQAHAALGYGPRLAQGKSVPLTMLAENEGDSPALGNNASTLAQLSAANLVGGQNSPQPLAMGQGNAGGMSMADFDTLIDLIATTVAPDSWDDVGGPGSMAPFEGNLSLVISNTQEVHDEIVSLLEQLRRLQDLQVTIEVRFITLQDNFFERIGVDFDFDINDGTGLVDTDLIDPNVLDEDNSNITIGLDPSGNPTLDLDLSFTQSSFGGTTPAFGGFDPGSAANFGFAILSDIEAFFLVEAIQGDTRTNVMQAPKITLFNGQFAQINDNTSRPFVTSVVPVVGDFAVAQQPIILVLAEGTQMNVQAVVSADRRFVRMTLLPMFSQIGDVETFTFEGRTDSNTGSTTEVDGDTNTTTTTDNNQQFTEGTTVQLPAFASTSITTTVSVPDGGTILMGGIKRLAEGRNERGVPVLGKLPYISRLFKNVGIGRETQTLMMMVTPRIIIQEEEEERVLGTPVP